MPQVCNDSDRPFIFSYGGRPYIIPPNHGGRWKLTTEKQRTARGVMRNVTVAKKVGDSTRTYIDIPVEAWRQLQNDSSHIERHKGRVRLLQDVQSELEAEMKEIQEAKVALQQEQEMFNAQLAVATASDLTAKKPTRKKPVRG